MTIFINIFTMLSFHILTSITTFALFYHFNVRDSPFHFYITVRWCHGLSDILPFDAKKGVVSVTLFRLFFILIPVRV